MIKCATCGTPLNGSIENPPKVGLCQPCHIAQLTRERDAARRDLDLCMGIGGLVENLRAELEEAKSTAITLRQRCEALEKDKARLDWLEHNCLPSGHSETYRAAIDAAMSPPTAELNEPI